METRDDRGLWKKGVSGNPNGRPKQLSEIKSLVRQYTPQAIEALVRNLDDENGSVRNVAAQALLDRGYGKPAQAIVGDDELDPLRVLISRIELVPPDDNGTSGASA